MEGSAGKKLFLQCTGWPTHRVYICSYQWREWLRLEADSWQAAHQRAILFVYSLFCTMTLLYRSKWTFTDSLYCKSVRGLAFSPDGSYLAYGSGENLCILNAIDKRLVYIVRGRNTPKGVSTVTALTWLPHDAFHLLCTFSDGLIATVTRLAVSISVSYQCLTI